MNTEVILYGQAATFILFIVAIFILYRLLVQNKESTIQLLEKRIEDLNDKMSTNGADILSSNLEKRISVLSNEIKRLNEDENINTVLIKEKEQELISEREMYERLQLILMHAAALSISYFCPECGKPTIEYAEAKAYFKNEENDTFLITYNCGYSEINGEKNSKCCSENR